jgi:hypothetical protein
MRTNTTIVVILLTLWAMVAAFADDDHDQQDRDRDYIIERQQDYLVEGPPTDRIINGSRELDGYRQRDGSVIWYDRLNVAGVTPPDEN